MFVILTISAAACDPSSAGNGSRDVPAPTPVKEAPPAGEKAKVSLVIDGDTIEVSSQGEEYRVRYIGVDTPERDEPFYSEATNANGALVENQEIVMVQDVSETDPFGRLLRYIYLADGTFVNAELIRQGYGRVVTFPPDVAHAEMFTGLQQEARENQRGLWALSEMLNMPEQCSTCGKNAHDCRDFDTQAAAQSCFDFCMAQTGKDIHHLDGGGDGIVCESLP